MNITRERIRQIEVCALAKLERRREIEALREVVDEGPIGRRRLPVLRLVEPDEDLDEDEEGSAA